MGQLSDLIILTVATCALSFTCYFHAPFIPKHSFHYDALDDTYWMVSEKIMALILYNITAILLYFVSGLFVFIAWLFTLNQIVEYTNQGRDRSSKRRIAMK